MKPLSSLFSLFFIVGAVSVTHAQCWVEDASFANADGGCKDLTTGLVWSADSRAVLGRTYGTTRNDDYYASGFNDLAYGGYTDWRLPTLADVEAALDNGLNGHLDFFLDGGTTPDNDEYRWVADVEKFRGSYKRFSVRFLDGDVRSELSGGNPIVVVRGVLPEDPRPGNANGKGKNNSATLLSSSATVPEPSTLILGALCFCGLALRRPVSTKQGLRRLRL